MGLRSFVVKRLINSFILVLLVILLNFAIFKAMPGDPVQFLMQPWSKESPEARKAQEELIRSLWGFDEPIEVQVAKYIRNLLTLQLGITFMGRQPIATVLARKIPYTLLLLGGSTIISLIIGVYLGILVIQRRGGLFDSGAVMGSLIIGSLPTFWIGLVLLLFFYSTLRMFPNAGAFPRDWAGQWPVPWTWSSSTASNALHLNISVDLEGLFTLIGGYLWHLTLPMVTLVIFFVGGWLLLTRATMLETVTEDYVITARAKGLKEREVLWKHAFKNASLPIITSAALSFGFILTGAIITETVFTYPGLGQWTWESILFLDYQVLMAIFYIISLCVIIANIVADLLYGIIDPRIKYG